MAHYFTNAERDKANSYNLIDLLRYAGYNIVKAGNEYYLKEHDSLKLSEHKGWKWFSKDIGGDNIGLFMELENLSFTESCERIFSLMNEKTYKTDIEIGDSYKHYESSHSGFRRPPKNDNNKRAAAYLIKTRGIDSQLVFKCLNAGDIYEAKNSHNCVFVGKDYDGNVVSSFEKGTGSAKKFVRDTYGSNKNYRFRILNSQSDKVNVFEAEIDLLSYISIYGDMKENYIALGGVSDKALKTFLQENKSDIRHINLCLDNDDAGNSAAEKLTEIYKLGYEVTREKPKLKDFNEDLLASKDKNFNMPSIEDVKSDDIEAVNKDNDNSLGR